MTPALAAAARFRGRHFLHGYARGKARWDPAYPAVAQRLTDSPLPLLDVGCGVGLMAAYLRECGCRQPILGIDLNERKINLARQRVAPFYPGVEFQVADARTLPEFSGDIVMLDVLHYFDPAAQQGLLDAVADRVAPGGRALIRTTFRQRCWRYYATLTEELLIRLVGWIRAGPARFPTREQVTQPFARRGWEVAVSPMWGRTPFNSYFIEARRPTSDAPVPAEESSVNESAANKCCK